MRKSTNFHLTAVFFVVVMSFVNASFVDQSQESFDGCGLVATDITWAQTFTAGVTGRLESVDIYFMDFFFPSPQSSFPSMVSIVDMNGLVPNGPVLGECYIESFTEGFNNANFLSDSIFLTAGTQYAIVLSNEDADPFDEESTDWAFDYNDVYAGGSVWNWQPDLGWNQDALMPDYDFSQFDAAFKTYMVPEPALLAYLCIGYLFILRRNKT